MGTAVSLRHENKLSSKVANESGRFGVCLRKVMPVFAGKSIILRVYLGEVKDGKEKRFYTD